MPRYASCLSDSSTASASWPDHEAWRAGADPSGWAEKALSRRIQRIKDREQVWEGEQGPPYLIVTPDEWPKRRVGL